MFSSLVAAWAVKDALTYLKQHGTSVGYERFMPFLEFQAVTDTPMVRQMEQTYVNDLLTGGM